MEFDMTDGKNKKLSQLNILSSEVAFETPWFVIRKYSYLSPLGHRVPEYFVHETPEAVMCVCLTRDNLVVLERPYRFPLRKYQLEFPAGYVQPSDKNLEYAALRELREETGFIADKVEYLFSFSKDSSMSSGVIHVFFAQESHRVKNTDMSEEIVSIELLNPNDIHQRIISGEMSCGIFVAAFYRVAEILNWRFDK
jgi:8-oxo-dGTP pyrophosphatase MutT (NUDIX family)